MPRVATGPDPARLAEEAFTVADLHRDGKLTRESALRELAARCPGYTSAEYEQAFGQGLLESR
jgi:hypothetical protein